MHSAISENSEAASVLTSVYRLHALNTIQTNLADYILADIVTKEQAGQIRVEFNTLCDEISQISPELCDSFAIPEELLSAPIARDWQEFNQHDNRGEVQAGVF